MRGAWVGSGLCRRWPRLLEIAAGGAWLLKYNIYEILHHKGRKVKATPYLHSPPFTLACAAPAALARLPGHDVTG